MAKEIRARFSHGVLKPLEALDLKEGEEVKVLITERPQGKGMIEECVPPFTHTVVQLLEGLAL
jgi:predicted DNA-binding antitoxin AbrB/MazE fold protein